MATHISNVRKVPMSIIGFQTRDGKDKQPYWIHNELKEDTRFYTEPYVEGQTILIVDDIYDTGYTMDNVIKFVKSQRTKPSPMPTVVGFCLFGKQNAKDIYYANEHDGSWVSFPWERLDESV